MPSSWPVWSRSGGVGRPAPSARSRRRRKRIASPCCAGSASTCSACRRRREEIDAFLEDTRPDAYERLVDRLLARPHYGERWGRHWLDLARYADSDGFEKDTGRPFAWRYRDWVIDALNRDLPFDQFTIEQLAGDLLPEAPREQKIGDRLPSQHADQQGRRRRSGAVPRRGGGRSRQHHGKVFLGLTLGCAQCHDHKYDPLQPARVLPALRLLQQRRRGGPAGPAAGRAGAPTPARRRPSTRRSSRSCKRRSTSIARLPAHWRSGKPD